MESITVTILNWNKYNPRKDYKTPVWFALSNRIVEDPDLYSFDPLEFKAFVYILCQASQKSSPTITINFDHASRVSNIKKAIMIRAINKLCAITPNAIVMINDDKSNSSIKSICTDICTDSVRHITNKHNITNKQTNTFDFEEAYKNYPRKIGKDSGIKRLNSRIKTQEDFNSFVNAVKNYASHCRKERIDQKFMKHFSSFVGTDGDEPWRDFAAIDPPVNAASRTLPQVAELVRAPLTAAEIELNKKRHAELMEILNSKIKTPEGA